MPIGGHKTAILAASGAGGDFSPSDISNLQLWFDSTLDVTDGGDGSVETWGDQSTNSDDATQTVEADKPTTGAATQNSLNVITTGVGEHFDLPSDIGMTGSTNRTIFFAGEPAASCAYFSMGTGTNARFTFRNASGTSDLRVEIQGDGDTSAISATGFGIFGCLLNGTNLSGVTVFSGSTDETLTGTTTINTSTTGNHIAALQSTSQQKLPFTSIGELIVYGKALTDSERDQVGNYLADRWAVSWTNRA